MAMNVIEKEIIKTWKNAGGKFAFAAEELEKEIEEEEQEHGTK